MNSSDVGWAKWIHHPPTMEIPMALVTVFLFPAFGFAAAALGVRNFMAFERRHHAVEA